MESKRLLPIFIINLERDVEKREYMEKLCARYSLDVHFINAIDGRKLSDEDVNIFYSSEKAKRKLGRELGLGEIGCALSHRKIYNKMIAENIEKALILEDDVTFGEELPKLLALNFFPKDGDIVFLGHTGGYPSLWGGIKVNEQFKLRRPCVQAWCTYGYCINIKGAKKMLNHLDVIFQPIDVYTGNDKYVNIYVLEKPIIIPNESFLGMSNLEIERISLSNEGSNKSQEADQILGRTAVNTSIFFRCINKVQYFWKYGGEILKPVKSYKR